MNLKRYLPAILLVGSFAAQPLEAQFVSIVHDPINYIEMTYQNGNLIQQVALSLQLFQLALQETTALRNKNFMLAAGYLSNFATLGVAGHSDWTIAITTAGGIIPAGIVWRGMTTVPPGSFPYLTVQNRVALADAMGPSTIDALGGCNASLLQSDGAISALEQIALSTGILDNTNDSLGGQRSVGTVQQLRIQECQHNLQQQQAQLQLLDTLRERDYENAQFNTYQNIDLIANANPAGIVNLGGLLTADFN